MKAAKERIRIGIVGAGKNTRARHIPGFRKIPGVEITVVCNRSQASSQRAAEEFGIPRIAGHWSEVAAADDVDAVMIGTWPYLHAEATIAALEKGKHVLTEARMARNLEEAEGMLAASRRHPELVTQIVPAPMSLEADETVGELVAGGRLGELREVCVTHTGGQYADASVPLTWRQDYELSGINVLTLGIVHEIVLRWMGKNPQWVAADAEVFSKERFDPERGRGVAVRIPESISVLGRLGSGARLAYHLSGVETGTPRREIRLNGSRACVRFDLGTGDLFLAAVGGEKESLVAIPPERRRGWRVEEDFIDSIRTGAPVRLISFEEGVRYMRFVEAVWRSWKGGGEKANL